MPRKPRFTLVFAPETLDHLKAIEPKHHPVIRKEVSEQLRYSADQVSRNRKPIEQPAPFGATWELRFGPGNRFRVFYEIESQDQAVWILAIGVKKRDRLFVGGEEFIS
jgi:mRNA-degrading endonuclease RelE of RelBE toxin-antitoxin system